MRISPLHHWRSRSRAFRIYTISGVVFFFLCVGTLLLLPPFEDIYYPRVFIVGKGDSISTIAEKMREERVIASPFLFTLSNYFFGGKIVWGSYHFHSPSGAFFRARDLYIGQKNAPLKRIVIHEGSNLYHIADSFEKYFNNFDKDTFLEKALEHHGYLYPDTYLFTEDSVDPDYLIEILTATFRRRTNDLFENYNGNLSRDEIITLASIVELEASRQDDRRKIAGVLFNRLEQNIPLQVDVSFLFISGKHTFTLSRKDLATDDPSNTYKYEGIPPIPISNPSRESIEAVMNPDESDNIYFLADRYGNTYYSETYQEHLIKKAKYVDVRK